MGEGLLSHPAFGLIKGWLATEVYGRDTNTAGRARRRVELRRNAPSEVVELALGIVVDCPKCAARMNPFRQRLGSGERGPRSSIYFAAACPELPGRATVDTWAVLALNPAASEDELRRALLVAASSFRTCCKGGPARDAHEAVVAAIEEDGTSAHWRQVELW